jgi:hypothetical protein
MNFSDAAITDRPPDFYIEIFAHRRDFAETLPKVSKKRSSPPGRALLNISSLPLIIQPLRAAGIGTCVQVAGLHRASPSTSLDKSILF